MTTQNKRVLTPRNTHSIFLKTPYNFSINIFVLLYKPNTSLRKQITSNTHEKQVIKDAKYRQAKIKDAPNASYLGA